MSYGLSLVLCIEKGEATDFSEIFFWVEVKSLGTIFDT